jgi:hypothetical protein
MELLEDQRLRHRTSGRPLKYDDLIKFGIQIADALEE